MSNLVSRLERLEREMPDSRQRFIWVDRDQTPEEALRASGGLRDGEIPMFFSWQHGD